MWHNCFSVSFVYSILFLYLVDLIKSSNIEFDEYFNGPFLANFYRVISEPKLVTLKDWRRSICEKAQKLETVMLTSECKYLFLFLEGVIYHNKTLYRNHCEEGFLWLSDTSFFLSWRCKARQWPQPVLTTVAGDVHQEPCANVSGETTQRWLLEKLASTWLKLLLWELKAAS